MKPIIKLSSWVKSSFTLLELILSLIILGLIYSFFLLNNKEHSQNSQNLNSLENSFDTKNYNSFIKENKTLKLIINKNQEENIPVIQYLYDDGIIRLKKYEN